VPRMRGADYLGPELDYERGRYRLKFMRNGQVIWVDVDGPPDRPGRSRAGLSIRLLAPRNETIRCRAG
jgi:hypothetical protein